jgi:pyruvate-formate lyase
MAKNDNFAMELNFTEQYRKYQREHIAIREVMCLKTQFPAVLTEILAQDLFAGRIHYGAVGFSPQFGGFGYFCDEFRILDEIEKGNLSPEQRERVMEMLLFWRKETTTRKIEAAFTDDMNKVLCKEKITQFPFRYEPEIATPLYRMAGVYIDYEKLMKLGISGMMAEVAKFHKKAVNEGGDVQLFEAMQWALELFSDVCHFYQNQALDMARLTSKENRKKELLQMANGLGKIATEKPGSFREAIQLAWLYSIVCGSLEFGRMDVYLGDFYAHDIDNGLITEAEALEMLQSIWRLIADLIVEVDGRVIIGGKGRPNEQNADRFALLAMEASRTERNILPQLTLRFYEGMNPALMDKAITIIGEGCTVPLLYNDDVNIPAVSAAFEVPEQEAEQYVPFGCGEYVLNHMSYGTPSGSINLLKLLEVTLHNGLDPVTGMIAGLQTGGFKDFRSFDELWAAYQKQVNYFVEILADHEELEYRITGESAPFLFMSMFYDDCLERGKGVFAGGIRYLGGTLESYGNVNTADSLTVIKDLVYDRQLIAPEKLLTILQNNFRGFESEHKIMLECPKFGNDDPKADEMLIRVHDMVCRTIRDQKNRTHLHSYLAVIINNSMNTTLGRWVGASADGRKAGGAMANANTPAGGNDKKGITAMINSISKPNHRIHAGAVHNMRFGRSMFTDNRDKFEAILKTYFKKGGNQAMITVINKGDLEKAMVEPEKYKDLFVRVGGFCARFVDLPRDVQSEVISRTTY